MIGFKNPEGYQDPTPYMAIMAAEGKTRPPFMPLVYICSPYRSDPEANMERTRKFCRFRPRPWTDPFGSDAHVPTVHG